MEEARFRLNRHYQNRICFRYGIRSSIRRCPSLNKLQDNIMPWCDLQSRLGDSRVLIFLGNFFQYLPVGAERTSHEERASCTLHVRYIYVTSPLNQGP